MMKSFVRKKNQKNMKKIESKS